MSELLREVDEMMRQERIMKFWNNNAPYIIGFVVLSILLTGGMSFYKSWDLAQREKQTAIYLESMEAEDFPAGALETSKNMRGDLRALYLLQSAGAALEDEDTEQAAIFYEAIINDSAAPKDIKDSALIMNARIAGNPEEHLSAIEAIANDNGNAWQADALLEAAAIAKRKGEGEQAILHLEQLMKLETAPADKKQQAQDLLRLYKSEAQN